MARTHPKWFRAYFNGYDLSGHIRSTGTNGITMQASEGAALSDGVMNTVIGRASVVSGPYSAFLDPDEASAHDVFKAGFGTYNIMVVYGTPNGPAMGDPIFAATMEQAEYTGQPDDSMFPMNISFPGASSQGVLTYDNVFGVLLLPKSTKTAANSANTNVNNGGATTKGGIFVYQAFSSDGTFTLSVDDSANGTSWLALSGATSGALDASVTPKSGLVALSKTATVRQYLRWQLALDTATTVTFALGFIRGT